MRKVLIAATAALVLVTGATAHAGILSGQTFSITTDYDYFAPMPYGFLTPGPEATAGMYGNQGEWIAARSEFDLVGQTMAGQAILSFTVDSTNFGPAHAYPRTPIAFGIYRGDNVASLGDFMPSWSMRQDIDFAQFPAGATFSLDVTSFYNSAVANGDPALGVGLDNRTLIDTFVRFGDFQLSTVSAVPEPATATFMLAGLGLLFAGSRLRRRGRTTSRPDRASR